MLPFHPPYKDEGGKRDKHSLHAEIWKNVPSVVVTFPRFQDHQGQRYHEPLHWKAVQSLKYGDQAVLTITQVESLQQYCMIPFD